MDPFKFPDPHHHHHHHHHQKQHHHRDQNHLHHEQNFHRHPSRRNRSKSPPKASKFHHTGPEFHQNFYDWQRAGHRAIFGGTGGHLDRRNSGHMTARRFSSQHHHHRPTNYLSESDYELWPGEGRPVYPGGGGGRHRSRSSPPLRPRDPLDFGRFSAHDLHAANERRASRHDLADLRDQLFVRSTSHNDLAGARVDRASAHANHGHTRASGRDLLTRWERQHCETCNARGHTLKRHSVSHHHLPHF